MNLSLATLGLALIAITASTIAQALLKYGMDKAGGFVLSGPEFWPSVQRVVIQPYMWGGLFLVVIGVPLWLQVLSKLPLSVAYPLVSVGYIISLLIGAFILKESITPMRIFGVALIIGGVIAVSRSQ